MGLFDFVKGIGKKIQRRRNRRLRQQHLQSPLHKRLPISFWGILRVWACLWQGFL